MVISVHDKLRTATAQAHRQLEAALPLMKPGFTLDEYASLLQRFLALYAPLERQLSTNAAFAHSLGDWPARLKVPKLRADLADLGHPVSVAPCEYAPRVGTRAAAFGVAYVMEGATLGGQLISRHLEQHLGVHHGHAGRFFSGYAQETGARWRGFLAALAAQPEETHDEITRASVETFKAFRAWLAPSSS